MLSLTPPPSPVEPAGILLHHHDDDAQDAPATLSFKLLKAYRQNGKHGLLRELAAWSDTDIERHLSTLTPSASAPTSPETPSPHPLITLPRFQAPAQSTATPPPQGSCTLVGAGPGDPNLLTLAALTALSHADLIVSDRLIQPSMHAFIRSHLNPTAALRIARKPVPHLRHTPGHECSAAIAQRELMDWCAEGMQAGQHVVRLKNGDPFVFGRGGEELRILSAHGPVRVIPGISSAFCAPLCAGIPVTFRGVADQVVVATGRRREGADGEGIERGAVYAPESAAAADLPVFAASRTVVLLMAVGKMGEVARTMVGELGYPADLPAAVIEKATWTVDAGDVGAAERAVFGTVGSLPALVKERGIKHHATIVIGNVVSLAHSGSSAV
ncbi:uroporphyrin-III C-methyltransferase [Phlyctochytrium bullatum]|nr:uroporphyrin-III C-methyltransferase [Phlyctochytrium bullatum]